MGFYPVAVSLRQCNTLIHKSKNTRITYTLIHIIYTQIHISHKITPLKTNKTKKNKSPHNAIQTMKAMLQPMNTAYETEKK
jgi:hypothetical protein